MKIKTIEYRELQTHNYENETVGMTAEVEEGEDVAVAMTKLREAVRSELSRASQEREANDSYSSRLRSDIYSLDAQKRGAERDLKSVNREIESRTNVLQGLRGLFDRMGIEFTIPEQDITLNVPVLAPAPDEVGDVDASMNRFQQAAFIQSVPETDDADPFANE